MGGSLSSCGPTISPCENGGNPGAGFYSGAGCCSTKVNPGIDDPAVGGAGGFCGTSGAPSCLPTTGGLFLFADLSTSSLMDSFKLSYTDIYGLIFPTIACKDS